MFSTKRLWSGVALAALSFSTAEVAHAQSTASQIQEDEIIVTARHDTSANGLGTQVNDAKDVSIVTQQYFRTQIGSSNFGQLINLLPGISYSSEDYTGVLSGDFRMHGFDGNHVSVLIDGSPVNDTGNYAVFPGEYIPSEITARTTVNIGATDVDSPTASAVGGTVNIVSVLPSDHPDVRASFSDGSYDLRHVFGQIDTGPVGPFGTTSFLSVNYTDADKWKGEGDVERFGLDGRIYQPLHGDDFMSVAFTWASDRPYFYQSGSRAQLASIGDGFDYNPAWNVPTRTPGSVDSVPLGLAPYNTSSTNDTQYWALHPNPVDFGDIRGQSRFTLGNGLTLTVDPSFFYTLANGGGATALSECDARLRGNTQVTVGAAGTCTTGVSTNPLPGNGVDLNGDGDVRDTVVVYSPNNTNTYRWGLNTSLLWDLNDQNHLQFAYTLDYGLHRQTGEFSPVNQLDGTPSDVFGGRDGVGIVTNDGFGLEGRDRQSIAELNQFSVNYLGEFMDDRLHVNIGVRDPYFQRDLDQRCYTYNGTTQFCDNVNQAAVLAAYNADIADPASATTRLSAQLNKLFGVTNISFNPSTDTPNFRFPFQETVHYNQLLPNAGVSYRLGDNHLFYLSYAQGFSAPKTDDLYASTTENVDPETSTMYGLGYRYQGSDFMLSFNLWRSDYQNRIVQSFDPDDPTVSIDRNVGDVRLQGIDIEGTWRPVEHLTLYGSATFQDSEVQSNIFTASVGGVAIALPTRGKELVLTPDQEFAARVQYDLGYATLGLQAKYQGRRFLSDMNDDSVGAFTVVDFDANVPLRFVNDHTSLQLNVLNIFDEDYFTRSNTATNFHPVTVGSTTVNAASGPFLFLGAPRTVTLTLRTQF